MCKSLTEWIEKRVSVKISVMLKMWILISIRSSQLKKGRREKEDEKKRRMYILLIKHFIAIALIIYLIINRY